jgi:hypothetical protein
MFFYFYFLIRNLIFLIFRIRRKSKSFFSFSLFIANIKTRKYKNLFNIKNQKYKFSLNEEKKREANIKCLQYIFVFVFFHLKKQ